MELKSYGYTAQVRLGSVDYTYRPLIDVEVGGADQVRTFKALVDSGTDITMMDQTIAVLLGIDADGKQTGKASTLGSVTNGFLASVSLKIDGFSNAFTFNVLFVENLSNNFEIILGQQDFFQNFDVTFVKSSNQFYLKLANA